MFNFFTITSLYLVLLFPPSIAYSESFDNSISNKSCQLPATFTSEALVLIAINCNANQKALTSHWQAQKHHIEFSDSLDNPKISIGVAPQTFGEDKIDDGYIVNISQAIPWPGTLSLKKQAAKAKTDIWLERRTQAKIMIARDVRISVAQWHYHNQLLVINKQHQQLWHTFIPIIRSNYATGTSDFSAVLQATHEQHLLSQESIELSASILRDVSQIKQLLNLPASSQLKNTNLLANTSITLPNNIVEKLVSQLENQPLMQSIDAQRRYKNIELKIAKKDRYPALSVVSRYNTLWMNESKRWIVGVGLNLPLDYGRRSKLEDSLRAEQDAIHWEQQDVLIQLREQLFQSHSLFNQSKSVLQLFQNELLPIAAENLTIARNEYQSGHSNFISLLTAQRQSLTMQREAQTAVLDRTTNFAKLMNAAGLVKQKDWHSIFHIDIYEE